MDGEVLYVSKSLASLWLPEAFHSPFLASGPNGRVEWFWRLDATVAAWGTRMLAKAKAAGAEIPGNPERRLRLIREHLNESQPGSLVTVDTLARSPVSLSGDELIANAVELSRWGAIAVSRSVPG